MSDLLDPGEEQFFEQGEQPSLEGPEVLEAPEVPGLLFEAPGFNARRARLRRVVAAALLGGAVLLGAGLLSQQFASRAPLAAGKLERRAILGALLPSAHATASASAAASPAEPSRALEPSATASTKLDSAALTRTARTLLEAGHTRDGVAAARAAVSANRNDAEPYILLAAGLQDLGRWAEAQAVFKDCKQATSSGPNADCRYFAGR